MCGIAGLVAGDDRPVDERELVAMTRAMTARGPDGEGYHLAPGIGLGHRRLAVIDVEGGRQPLFGEDGRIVAVVNGEIYNFGALRAELERLGHRFRTRTDSEVVVHGFEQWGEGVLERLEGMFALAVWDARARRLVLARDRLGEKPLYWAALPGGGLAFASELKAIRRCAGVDGRVDAPALARYLVYEYVPAPATILRGVRKLEPGTLLAWRAGAVPEVRPWWDLPLPAGGGAATVRRRLSDPAVAAEALLDELRRAVRARLVADVPLGVFLSGGIDSSTVAALAAEARGGDLDTFCVGFDDPSFDESGAARAVARALGVRHHEERLSARAVLELVPSLGALLDEPLGDASIVPSHLLARFARRHVTVALGGDGGDELFAGYPTFQAERAAALLLDPLPVAGRLAAAAGRALARALPVSTSYFSLDFKVKQFLKGADETGPRRHQAWLASFLPADALGVLAPAIGREVAREALRLDPDGPLGPAIAPPVDLYDVIDRRMDRCRAPDRWDRLLYFYAKGYLGDDVLAKVDRATMAVGLEARAPLLDTGVVTLACRLAPALRLRGLETKHVLKRAVRGLLPPEIIGRRKQGFAMPIGPWLRGSLWPLVEDVLSADRLRRDGFFEVAPVRRLIAEHVAGVADHRKPLWTLLAFQLWWAHGAAAPPPAGGLALDPEALVRPPDGAS